MLHNVCCAAGKYCSDKRVLAVVLFFFHLTKRAKFALKAVDFVCFVDVWAVQS